MSEQDFPGAGDLCLGCHTPLGWLAGRSEDISGHSLRGTDLDGVQWGAERQGPLMNVISTWGWTNECGLVNESPGILAVISCATPSTWKT